MAAGLDVTHDLVNLWRPAKFLICSCIWSSEGAVSASRVPSLAPYDRALALASLVRTMRDHYLAVRCSCGAARVIGLGQMARDRRFADRTLAHVALRLRCAGCHNGPDEVHLTATTNGVGPLQGAHQSLVWTLLLINRPIGSAKHLRHGQAE